jgi:hypothetical protein
LTNYIAYSQNWSSEQNFFIANFIQKQPDDYKYALNFSSLKKEPLEIAKQWRKLKIKPEDDENWYSKEKDEILIFIKLLKNNELNKYKLYKNYNFFNIPTILSIEDGLNYYHSKNDDYFIHQCIADCFLL